MGFINTLVRIFYKCAFNLKIEGIENIPKDGGIIITPNHTSNFDPPLIGCVAPRKVSFMAKSELFKNKLFGKILSALGAFPVQRGKGDIEAIKHSIRILRNKEALIIFPHGTRINQGDDIPLKNGAVMIAIRSQVNIVPVYITGTYKFRKKITIRFGKEFDLSKHFGTKPTADEQTQISAQLWEEMKKLQDKSLVK